MLVDLRAWIHDEIATHIKDLSKSVSGAIGSPLDDNIAQYMQEDGVFRIAMAGNGKVQITSFNGSRKTPYKQVYVSDSYVGISVDIDPAASNSIQQECGTKLCHLAGSVLDLQAVDLVLKPKAAVGHQVTLYIKSCRLFGRHEGAANIGNPTPLENLSDIRQFLLSLREGQAANVSRGSGRNLESDIQSQPSDDSDAEGTIATQTHIKPKMPLPVTIRDRQAPAVRLPRQSHDNTMTALFSMVAKPSERRSPATTPKHQTTCRGSSESCTAPKPLPTGLDEHCSGEGESPHFTGPPEAESTFTDVTITRSTTGLLDLQGGEKNTVDQNQSSQRIATESVSEESVINGTMKIQCQTLDVQGTSTNWAHMWTDLKRIPRRYVRIPKDQQHTLAQDAAWLTKADGKEYSYAHIPGSILSSLKAFHEQKGPDIMPSSAFAEPSAMGIEDAEDVVDSEIVGDLAASNVSVGNDCDESLRLQQIQHLGSSEPMISNSVDDCEVSEGEDSETTWTQSPSEHFEAPEIARIAEDFSDPNTAAGSVTYTASQKSFEAHVSADDTAVTVGTRAVAPLTSYHLPANLHLASDQHMAELPDSIGDCIGEVEEDDDELELAVPHSVKDVAALDDFRGTDSSSKAPTVAHFPSTDRGAQVVLQVERTPNVVIASTVLDSPSVYRARTSSLAVHSDHERFSSDPVIPGTAEAVDTEGYQDQEMLDLPTVETTSDTGNIERLDIQGTSTGVCPSTPLPSFVSTHLQSSLPAPIMAGEEDEIASQQLFQEYESYSKRGNAHPRRRSPVQFTPQRPIGSQFDEVLRTVRSSRIATPTGVHDDHEGLPFNTYPKVDVFCDGCAAKRSAPKSSQDLEPPQKKRRCAKLPDLDFSQDDFSHVEISELARANRQGFMEKHQISLNLHTVLSTAAELTALVPDHGSFSSIVNNVERPFESVSAKHNSGVKAPTLEASEPNTSNSEISAPIETLASNSSEIDSSHKIWDSTNIRERNTLGNPHTDDRFLIVPDQDMEFVDDLTPTPARNYDIGIEKFPDQADDGTDARKRSRVDTSDVIAVYRDAYPEFYGTLNSIIKVCVYIDWLRRLHKAPHPVLWDDFIRAFADEYTPYINRRKEVCESSPTHLDFYNTHVREPLFDSRIITLDNIEDVFSRYPQKTMEYRKTFERRERTGFGKVVSVSGPPRQAMPLTSPRLAPTEVPSSPSLVSWSPTPIRDDNSMSSDDLLTLLNKSPTALKTIRHKSLTMQEEDRELFVSFDIEPASEELVVEGLAERPAAKEPAIEQQAVDEPASSGITIEEPPVAEDPAAIQKIVEEPASQDLAFESSTAEELATEQPAVEEQPALKGMAIEEPTAEEPARERPSVVEEPAAASVTSLPVKKLFFETASQNAAILLSSPVVNDFETYRMVEDYVEFDVATANRSIIEVPNSSPVSHSARKLPWPSSQSHKIVSRHRLQDTDGGAQEAETVVSSTPVHTIQDPSIQANRDVLLRQLQNRSPKSSRRTSMPAKGASNLIDAMDTAHNSLASGSASKRPHATQGRKSKLSRRRTLNPSQIDFNTPHRPPPNIGSVSVPSRLALFVAGSPSGSIPTYMEWLQASADRHRRRSGLSGTPASSKYNTPAGSNRRLVPGTTEPETRRG